MSIEELKEHVIENYDPDDVLEALNLTTEDLVNAFEELLEMNSYKFEEVEDDDEGAD